MRPAAVIVPPVDLTAFVAAIVAATGSAPDEADRVAANLVLANLSGHDSHGVGLVPAYATFARGGGIVANQHVRVTGDVGAMLMLDGGRGYGQVIGREAMHMGMARARQHGMALVALRNTHHLGRIGQWAEDCAAEGLVSIHFVNALLKPLVAPFGGSDARFATNPLCVGVPRVNEPSVILDFATSRIALGKVRVALQEGRRLDAGILIDGSGAPSDDPRVMFEADAAGRLGAILPFGEHKGYGLAVICELLGGALAGGETLHEVAPFTGIYNNMLSILIDPARLDRTGFHREMEAFLAWLEASPPAPGFDRVRIAGEPEREMRARRAAGVPIDGNTWADLLAAARDAGVPAHEIARHAACARPAPA